MTRDPGKSPHRHLCVPVTTFVSGRKNRKIACPGSLICSRTLQTTCFELEINHIWQGQDTASSPLFCFSPNGRLRRSQCVRPDSANAPVAKWSVSFSGILLGIHGWLLFLFISCLSCTTYYHGPAGNLRRHALTMDSVSDRLNNY